LYFLFSNPKFYSFTTFDPNGTTSFNSYTYTLQTTDGGEVVATRSSDSNEISIEKTLNESVVLSKTVEEEYLIH